MSDERLKLQMVDAVYGELSDRALEQLHEALGREPELAEDLRSLEATRRLYAEDTLPEPADLLSEAILRQEKILRPAPQSWWTPLWQLLWHPAVGVTALVVVVATAGLLVRLATPPSTSEMSVVSTVSPAPAQKPAVAAATESAETAGGRVADGDAQDLPADSPDEARSEHKAVATPEVNEGFAFKGGLKQADVALAGDDDLERSKRKTAKKTAFMQEETPREVLGGENKPKAPTAWSGTRGQALNDSMARTLDEKAQAAPAKDRDLNTKNDAWDGRSDKREAQVADQTAAPQGATANRQAESEAPTYAQRAAGPHPSAPPAAEPQRAPLPGSAGQLTDPGILNLGDDESRAAGSAGNIGLPGTGAADVAGSSLGTSSSAKAARPLPSRRTRSANEEMAKELAQVSKLKHEGQAKEYLEAGMVAFDRRNYEEAVALFGRAEQLDRSNALAPGPLLGQARSFYKLKRYRDAAAIFERVLEGYPNYRQRQAVALQLVACYDALGNQVAAKRARRVADEAATLMEAEDLSAPAAAEPAQATPAAR
ncbi:MAG: tetratricopeptide repeat protein [Pseudomonadota bacterium]